MKNFRVLGCDPGKLNFGWAIYGDDGLEEHGVLEGAFDISRLLIFGASFERLVHRKQPSACCVERFHQRPGRGSSKNLELVNLMIGEILIIGRFHGIETELITASEHKRWIATHFEVKTLERKNPTKSAGINKKYDIGSYAEWAGIKTEHEVDAANIAKYAHDHKMARLVEKLKNGAVDHGRNKSP